MLGDSDALHDLLPFYNLKYVKTTNGGLLLLVKLPKLSLFHGCFFIFFKNCASGTKSRKASDILNVIVGDNKDTTTTRWQCYKAFSVNINLLKENNWNTTNWCEIFSN